MAVAGSTPSTRMTKKIQVAMAIMILVIGTVLFTGANRAVASIDSTLDSSGVGFAAIIQWGGSGNKLTGTYDSFGVTDDQSNTETPYSTESDHCSIQGIVSGSTINVNLMGCSDATSDGSDVAHEKGSMFLLTFPSSTGTLVSITFKSGSIGSYNRAVSAAKLFARQGNGLVTYESAYEPAQVYFSPTFSRPFKVESSWFDVMTQQINSAPDHIDSRVGAWVLRWSKYGWVREKQLTIDTFTPPGRPFALKLGPKVTAYGIEQSWMDFSEYDVVAYISHHWLLVPFVTDKRLRKAFLPNGPTTWKIEGPLFVKSVMGCISKHCGKVIITYSFNEYGSGDAQFGITNQSGPSFAFVNGKP
jgi:hypothetical protein